MLEHLAELITPIYAHKEAVAFMLVSLLIMLAVVMLLYKTYRASLRVAAQLNEFSSLSRNSFGGRLKLIEAGSEAYQLNPEALGPLARIVDEYCVITLTADNTISYVNQRFITLTGLPQKALIGQRQAFSHGLENEPASWNNMLATLKPEQPWHGEICFGTPLGNL